ncbi:FtsX-like permease family protein [Ekhidna sp.]|uniref:FtsX-like permease family protein n=1 Tax=Ekhidna sp. TaxID=2608089 RepID=UPI003B514297
MNDQQPPKGFRKLFEWFCEPELFEELQGDLEEAFYENAEELGYSKARSRYKKEVLRMIRPSVIKNFNVKLAKSLSLPRNYLKTSLRAIKLHPFYVFANVFGLALALSICTIGYFNYRYNSTFNTYFEGAPNLYKIHGERMGETTLGNSSIALAPALKAHEIPAFRYIVNSLSIKEGKRLFSSRIAFTDPEFLRYFPLNNLDDKPVKSPDGNQIIISERLALKLFNEVYPVGRIVKIVFPNQKEKSLIISDVFEVPPSNTSFSQSAFLPIEEYFNIYHLDEGDWSQEVNATFVFARGSELDRIKDHLNTLLSIRNENNPSTVVASYALDNILYWPEIEPFLYRGDFVHHLHPSSVAGIAGAAISVLLLACFNFINTSIALSGKRLKEIAVRKIMGGNRKSTISQFMIENTFMITMAVILSFGISYLLIPGYNALFERELIQLENVPFSTLLQFSIVIVLIVTLLSAAYPSLHVSKFSPLVIFRNKVVLSGKNRLTTILLTFQFALCFYNIFGVLLNVDNSYYQESLDRGYDVDKVINIPLYRTSQHQVLADALSQSPYVSTVSGTANLVGFSNEQKLMNYEGDDYQVAVIQTGNNYPETVGLRLNKGSFFKELGENEDKVIINSMLERQFGEDLLNKTITVNGERYSVIGVVDDFNLRNIMMDNKITPVVIKYSPSETYYYTTIRVNGDPNLAHDEIEKLWYEAFPQELYRGFLQSDVLESVRETNYIMIQINLFIALISILISILGLYTLISLKIQKRSKEFGVRKVLGASSRVIIHLLGKDLYWMIGIAATVGLAGSTMVLGIVFDIIYAYHIDPSMGHFIKTVIIVLVIVLFTVGGKVYQASNINPSQQLRAE